MKKSILIFVLINISLLLFSKEKPVLIDRILARIGDDVILESEFLEQKKQMNMYKEVNDIDALNLIIENKLFLYKAKSNENYKIDENKINESINEEVEKIKANFSSEEEFENQMKAYKVSLYSIKNSIRKSLEAKEYKQMIMQNEINNKIIVSNKEIEDYYLENIDKFPKKPATNKIAYITKNIVVSKKTKNNLKKQMKKILNYLEKGEDFSKLAREESDCPSAANGGDIGYFSAGNMNKTFEEKAFSLKVGEISNVFETDIGYHIIKKIDEKNSEVKVLHILKRIEPSKEDTLEIEKEVKDIYERLEKGEDFYKVYEKFSDDKSKNGIYGEYSQNEYPREITQENLNKNSLILNKKAILINNAYYIFYKLSSTKERNYELSEIRDKIYRIIFSEKQEKYYKEYIKQLKKEIFVEINY